MMLENIRREFRELQERRSKWPESEDLDSDNMIHHWDRDHNRQILKDRMNDDSDLYRVEVKMIMLARMFVLLQDLGPGHAALYRLQYQVDDKTTW